MQVNCEVRGDIPDFGSKCSFFAPVPVTLEKIRTLFPYEGVFHFRIKMAGDKVGCPECEHVWVDLLDSTRTINSDSNTIELRVLPIEIKQSDIVENYGGYLADVNDEIPKERQISHNISLNNKEEPDSSSSSIGKVLNNLKQSVTAAPINMNTVKAGASSIWNAVKATATHLQQQAARLDGGSLSSQAADNLSDLSVKLSTTYSDHNPLHVSLLERVFEVMFSGQTYARDSAVWKQGGWQKTDPIQDLKNSGVLALHAIVCLAETYPERTQRMLLNNRANTKNNYPFAIVGVNLTLMLAELFNLRDNKFATANMSCGELFRDYMAFYEVFNICFNHIDNLWTHRNAVRADFGKIIGEVKALLSLVLQRGPRSIEEFKLIGADEGLSMLE